MSKFLVGNNAYKDANGKAVIVNSHGALIRELCNRHVKRSLARVALKQALTGTHTCVYGGKWGSDLVEVVRI